MPSGCYKKTPEHIEKIAATHRGRKRSPETCNKISAAVPRGDKNHCWKGGRIISTEGYIYLLCPSHPYATKQGAGYVMEHRLVMEAHLGRTLLPTEVVHHINGDKSDNHIENLMLFSSNAKHRNYHNHERNHK